MARAIYSHEINDPDFQWLISNYAERKGGTAMVDVTCLPIVLVMMTDDERSRTGIGQHSLALLPPPEASDGEGMEDSGKK